MEYWSDTGYFTTSAHYPKDCPYNFEHVIALNKSVEHLGSDLSKTFVL